MWPQWYASSPPALAVPASLASKPDPARYSNHSVPTLALSNVTTTARGWAARPPSSGASVIVRFPAARAAASVTSPTSAPWSSHPKSYRLLAAMPSDRPAEPPPPPSTSILLPYSTAGQSRHEAAPGGHCTAFWWYCRPRAWTISCTYTESQSVVPYAAASRSHVKVPPKMYGRIMVHSTTVPVHVGPARPAVVPHEFPHVSARTVKKTTSTSSAAGAPSAVVLG